MNKKSNEKLEKFLLEFDIVLNSSKEQDIHDFLKKNDRLLGFNSWDSFVTSKYKLADKYVPDFVVVGLAPLCNSPILSVTFVEIERANEALFTKSGDPTSFLTHAIRQVQDWKGWVLENRNYLQYEIQKLILKKNDTNVSKESKWKRNKIPNTISYGFIDEYIVVAGRRNSMTMEDRLRLSQMNRDLDRIKVITYDVLMDSIFRELDRNRYNGFFYEGWRFTEDENKKNACC